MRVPMAAPLPCPMAPLHPPPSFLSLSTKMDCPHHGKSVLLLCSSFRAPAPSTSSLCCKSRPWDPEDNILINPDTDQRPAAPMDRP
ncbi:hypothetical protein U9M48_032077 [Paspalum notatum var. saurae]|uniref:Uncharacterized protein n=1 Tax=Paspalum notatum var. saurae TaxID=547442 RepID=A0AAQ3U4D0_PASNO